MNGVLNIKCDKIIIMITLSKHFRVSTASIIIRDQEFYYDGPCCNTHVHSFQFHGCNTRATTISRINYGTGCKRSTMSLAYRILAGIKARIVRWWKIELAERSPNN